MNITILSPYHGGSHRSWAEGYQASSRHQVRLLSLPARFWKWRMHGGAVTLARRFLASRPEVDLLLATDMLDLTTFLSLTRDATAHLPAVLYMHENQLTYPLPATGATGPMRRQLGERDYHYAFVNYASMMAADAVLFNSEFHLNSFFDALPKFLNHFPEYNERETAPALRRKSQVLPVGIDFDRLGSEGVDLEIGAAALPPLILWNQRWEYDKNPSDLFRALYKMKDKGIPFRLALCGQQFGRRPVPFDKAMDRLSAEIVHAGMADEETYRRLLWQAKITISTAYHEFFGIGVLEAIYCHTFPILPHRLSYPEHLPETFHWRCLYQNQPGLEQRLRWALTHPDEASAVASALALAAERYGWPAVAAQYDSLLEVVNVSAG